MNQELRTPSQRPTTEVPPRVLVACDDASLRTGLIEALLLDGYEVTEANDEPTLIERLIESATDPRQAPDLVMSDTRLVGMGVMDALARLPGAGPPVVFLAAPDGPAGSAIALCHGGVVFRATADLDDIRTAVKNLVSRAIPSSRSGLRQAIKPSDWAAYRREHSSTE